MGINYNFETEMCSLRKMCIVSVTQNILEIARHDPSTMDNPKSIASKAAEMVPKMDLPRTLNTEIVAIIRPVMKEMLRWYKKYGDVARAILTPHGTVDMTRSARAIVASDQTVCQRYVNACNHCLEDDIFNLGKDVTSAVWQRRCSPLANFWYNVYGGNFDVKIIRGSLSQEQVVEGWLLATCYCNISAIRYFQKEATMKLLQVILDRTLDNYGFCRPKYLSLTPALCNTCLNVLDCEWLERSKGTISTCLLLQLIEWPYQHIFLASAELLMLNLSQWNFCDIAWNISKKLSADYKDYNYKRLFVRFWNLGCHLLSDSRVLNRSLLVNLSLIKDEFLVSLVLDQISQMDEDYLNNYFNFYLSYVGFKLFYFEAYESIECIMRLLRTKHRKVFLKFQNAFNMELIEDVSENFYTSENFDRITGMENDSFLDRYEQSMSKYWVLPDLCLNSILK